MSNSHIAEQMEEQLEGYEKDTAKLAGKTAIKAGNKLFAFFIVKPTAKGLTALKDTIDSKTEKSKVSIKDLTANGETVKDLEITDENIKAFDPIARKYGIKYSLKEITPSKEELQKDPNTSSGAHGRAVAEGNDQPKYMVFFKAKDESVMKAALTEFSEKELAKKEKKKTKEKTKNPKKDVKKEVAKKKEIIDSRPKNPLNKNKNKER